VAAAWSWGQGLAAHPLQGRQVVMDYSSASADVVLLNIPPQPAYQLACTTTGFTAAHPLARRTITGPSQIAA